MDDIGFVLFDSDYHKLNAEERPVIHTSNLG